VVAQGIREHYQDVPTTLNGQWVALVDRLDTVVGILAVGLIPTGSSDPFALRRAVRNILMITAAIYPTYPLNLQQLFQEMVAILREDFPQFNDVELQHHWYSLVTQRLQTILQEKGLDYDLINALLGIENPEVTERILTNVQDLFERAEKLMNLRANGILQTIYATVNRATRLANQGTLSTSELSAEQVIEPQWLQKPIERELYEAVHQLLTQAQATQRTGDYDGLIQKLQEIAPILERFFDGAESVLVMDENPAIRQNRLNLLGLIRNSALVLADFSQIVKS
jgi:glycyl-tRNA synthetase beta chain